MHAGQTLLTSKQTVQTNPLFLTSSQNSLSPLGKQQSSSASTLLKKSPYPPTIIKYPTSTQTYETSYLLSQSLKLGRDRTVPEFTFMDQRGLGLWNGLNKTLISDSILYHDRTTGGEPPPSNEDGTPSDSLDNVLVRLRQLMSVLETQYSGESILLIFADGVTPGVLAAGLAGRKLEEAYIVELEEGEVWVDFNVETVKQRFGDDKRVERYNKRVEEGRVKLKELMSDERPRLTQEEMEFQEEQKVLRQEEELRNEKKEEEKRKEQEAMAMRRNIIEEEGRKRQEETERRREEVKREALKRKEEAMASRTANSATPRRTKEEEEIISNSFLGGSVVAAGGFMYQAWTNRDEIGRAEERNANSTTNTAAATTYYATKEEADEAKILKAEKDRLEKENVEMELKERERIEEETKEKEEEAERQRIKAAEEEKASEEERKRREAEDFQRQTRVEQEKVADENRVLRGTSIDPTSSAEYTDDAKPFSNGLDDQQSKSEDEVEAELEGFDAFTDFLADIINEE
ncbi:hypothetical protein TrST_g8528 [Triparma strigata]|uniref:Uncharacterized protein n=1 Tax=Triparma strigata TaxID=1606541 RepID=A0A9W7BKF9_9STRA|nr:hypothetical protein TrST_g8528 [Triparma strigata]